MTYSSCGPCTPIASVNSMSAVRDGPVINVTAGLISLPFSNQCQNFAESSVDLRRIDDRDVHRRHERNQSMPFACAVENQRAGFGNRCLRGGDADVEPENVVSVRSDTELFDFEIRQMKQSFDLGLSEIAMRCARMISVSAVSNPVVTLDDMQWPSTASRFCLKTRPTDLDDEVRILTRLTATIRG